MNSTTEVNHGLVIAFKTNKFASITDAFPLSLTSTKSDFKFCPGIDVIKREMARIGNYDVCTLTHDEDWHKATYNELRQAEAAEKSLHEQELGHAQRQQGAGAMMLLLKVKETKSFFIVGNVRMNEKEDEASKQLQA